MANANTRHNVLETLHANAESLTPSAIAGSLRVPEAEVQDVLDEYVRSLWVEPVGTGHSGTDVAGAVTYYRLTDAGRAELDQVRRQQQQHQQQ